MTQQECLKYIEEVKTEAEAMLQKSDERRLAELWKFLHRERVRFVTRLDRWLLNLSIVCRISIEEKRNGMQEMLLDQCQSLQGIETLYREIKWCCFRIENRMPEETIDTGIDYIISNRVSGIALYDIIKNETKKCTFNLLWMARYLKKRRAIMTATQLLLQADTQDKLGDELLLELADCWLEGMQLKQALETLKRIQKPSDGIVEIMQELEKKIGYETI